MQNAESHLSAPFVAANQQTRTELSRTEGDGTGAGCGTRAVMWKNRWISIRTCLRASRGSGANPEEVTMPKRQLQCLLMSMRSPQRTLVAITSRQSNANCVSLSFRFASMWCLFTPRRQLGFCGRGYKSFKADNTATSGINLLNISVFGKKDLLRNREVTENSRYT